MIDAAYGTDAIQTVFTFCTAGGARLREQDEVIAELRAQLRQQEALIAALREQNAQLQEQVRQLQAQLDDLNRTNKRQATPFARRKRVEQPKRPGRKKGQGRFSYRRKPAPNEVRETKEAPLSRVRCSAARGGHGGLRLAVIP